MTLASRARECVSCRSLLLMNCRPLPPVVTSSVAGVAPPPFNPREPGYGSGVVMFEDSYIVRLAPGSAPQPAALPDHNL